MLQLHHTHVWTTILPKEDLFRLQGKGITPYNNSLSKHFTQNLLQHTSYFIEHISLSQEVKHFLWVYIPKSKYKDFSCNISF